RELFERRLRRSRTRVRLLTLPAEEDSCRATRRRPRLVARLEIRLHVGRGQEGREARIRCREGHLEDVGATHVANVEPILDVRLEHLWIDRIPALRARALLRFRRIQPPARAQDGEDTGPQAEHPPPLALEDPALHAT